MRKLDLRNGLIRGTPLYILAIFILLVLLVFSILFAVTVGSADLSIGQVYGVIFYKLFGLGDPQTMASGAIHDIVWLIRLPRIVLGMAVGMGLAVVGVVMQAIVKNPLADPYVLGISSGRELGGDHCDPAVRGRFWHKLGGTVRLHRGDARFLRCHMDIRIGRTHYFDQARSIGRGDELHVLGLFQYDCLHSKRRQPLHDRHVLADGQPCERALGRATL